MGSTVTGLLCQPPWTPGRLEKGLHLKPGGGSQAFKAEARERTHVCQLVSALSHLCAFERTSGEKGGAWFCDETWRREVSAVSMLDLPDAPSAALAVGVEGGGSG